VSEVETWLSCLGSPQADRDYLPGHQRMVSLLDTMSLTQPQYRIRVAGTNGKGSTAFMLAHALQAVGFNVGLYTSPHIQHFQERIRINLSPVKEKILLQMLDTLLPHAQRIGASYFETATALALQYFSNQKVDIEILEAGVGARLDATTAVPADTAVITPIDLDHTDWLGGTLSAIAQEKAHIMNGCHDAVSAPQHHEVQRILTKHNPKLTFCHPEPWPHLHSVGNHQQLNASLAYTVINHLSQSLNFPLATAKKAIETAHIPGRLQHITHGQAHIWLDAAHNAHAIEALIPTLPHIAKPFDVIFCFTRADRDLSAIWPQLQHYTKKLITQSQGCRLDLALKKYLKNTGQYLILGSFTSVDQALIYLKHDLKTSHHNT